MKRKLILTRPRPRNAPKIEKYRIAPKALFALALVKAGIVDSPTCEEVDIAWEDFEASMQKWGYVE